MSWGILLIEICQTWQTLLVKEAAWLTQWCRVTHICIAKLTIIGSDNGLSPGRRQAIMWANDWILSIGPLATNSNDILFKIYTFSFKKVHLKMSSGKWRPFYLILNVLMLLVELCIFWNFVNDWIDYSYITTIQYYINLLDPERCGCKF